jgi:hypothetical protein
VHGNERTSGTVDPTVGGSLTRTFVVRVWEPPEPVWGRARGLRGVVEHVQTGASAAFESTDALLTFLETALDRTAGSATGGAS